MFFALYIVKLFKEGLGIKMNLYLKYINIGDNFIKKISKKGKKINLQSFVKFSLF